MKNILLIALAVAVFGCDKAKDKLEDINPINQFASEDDDDAAKTDVVVEELALDDELSALTDQYMKLLNDYRSDLGLDILSYSKVMEASAFGHSKNMATKAVTFGHLGSSARCASIQKTLGGGNLCGEIVAMGQKSIEAVFKSWKNSAGHRGIMLNPRYTHTGLGFYRGPEGSIYWTQIFLELN